MSQENVDIVRQIYDAWNRREIQSVLDHLHPDVVWEENVLVFPGLDRVYRGHEGFLKWDREAFSGVWESITLEALEFIDAGDHVVVPFRLSGKGASSGVNVEIVTYNVLSFRDGQVARRRLYTDRAEALEAAGLKE
jgi:ketosteroid isomerase-like protein